MQRREFITLLGGTLALPLTARAQQPERMRRIGVLMAYAESDREGQAWLAAFWEGSPEARVDGGPQRPARHSLGSG